MKRLLCLLASTTVGLHAQPRLKAVLAVRAGALANDAAVESRIKALADTYEASLKELQAASLQGNGAVPEELLEKTLFAACQAEADALEALFSNRSGLTHHMFNKKLGIHPGTDDANVEFRYVDSLNHGKSSQSHSEARQQLARQIIAAVSAAASQQSAL